MRIYINSQIYNYLMKNLFLILIISQLIYISMCGGDYEGDDGTQSPPVDDVTYSLKVEISNCPTTYISDDEDFLYVDMKSSVNPTGFPGYKRIWFEIFEEIEENMNFVERSNWLEIDPDDNIDKNVEWGGDTFFKNGDMGVYYIEPHAMLYTSEGKKNAVKSELKGINISDLSPYADIDYKSVEYDQQQGQDVWDDADLSNAIGGQLIVDQALCPADVTADFDEKDEIQITPVRSLDLNQLDYYIDNYKNKNKDIYICGVKQFENVEDTLDPYYGLDIKDALGFTIGKEGESHSGIFIACNKVHDIVNNYLNYDPVENQFITHSGLMQAAIIHELGHYLGGFGHTSSHPENPIYHSSIYCIMYGAISEQDSNELHPGETGYVPTDKRSVYINPHFCSECIQRIKNNQSN